jgi:hypothetical protein
VRSAVVLWEAANSQHSFLGYGRRLAEISIHAPARGAYAGYGGEDAGTFRVIRLRTVGLACIYAKIQVARRSSSAYKYGAGTSRTSASRRAVWMSGTCLPVSY